MCYVSCVMCHAPYLMGHMSQTTTDIATGTDPPPENSPTIDADFVFQKPKS